MQTRMEITTPRRVLFLCTGNSCRSQIAEALVNADPGHNWRAFSAGSSPTGYVHPLALKVLEEVGIHHKGTSKSLDTFKDQSFDLIITVCNDVEENCPVWLGGGRQLHLAFADPVKVAGTDDEKLKAFRRLRDEMRLKILPVLPV